MGLRVCRNLVVSFNPKRNFRRTIGAMEALWRISLRRGPWEDDVQYTQAQHDDDGELYF